MPDILLVTEYRIRYRLQITVSALMSVFSGKHYSAKAADFHYHLHFVCLAPTISLESSIFTSTLESVMLLQTAHLSTFLSLPSIFKKHWYQLLHHSLSIQQVLNLTFRTENLFSAYDRKHWITLYWLKVFFFSPMEPSQWSYLSYHNGQWLFFFLRRHHCTMQVQEG